TIMRLYIFAGLLTVAAFLAWQVSPCRSQSGEKTTPDQQVKALVEKYQKLSEKEKDGAKGNEVIEQLKKIDGKLSPQSQEAVARMVTAHNLRQLVIGVHNFGDKGLPWSPYMVRPKWEYKVMSETDLLKLGKDNLSAGLNKLGDDSWELVGLAASQFIFKRQK